MSYNLFHKLLLLLTFSFSLLNLNAQQATKIPLLNKDHREPAWYKEQRELWHKEVLKNKKSEYNWYNYFLASRYALSDLPWETSNAEMNKLFAEMEKAIPNSFTYNLTKGWHMGTWDKASMSYILEAYRLNPTDTKVCTELIVRYEVFGPDEKRKEFCQKNYTNNALSPGLINYNYNVLASLEKNAVLFTCGDNDTFPLWILQDALGFRTDVLVLNVSLCGIDEYRERKIKEAGINLPKSLLDSLHIGEEVDLIKKKHMQTNIVRAVAENTDRPVYIGLTMGDDDAKKAVEDNLYLIGLALRYSKDRIDNIALLKKNYEQNFLLDYLQIDFYTDEGVKMVNLCNQNYVTPFITLYKHYTIAGELQKAERIKYLLQKIASKSKREKEILDLIK